MPDDGELVLLVDGQRLSGWKEIRVTRGAERIPSDFNIALTEGYPGEGRMAVARAGSPCQVLIGGDVVLTGFIDRYMPEIDAGNRTVRAMGRGRCQDLVDCSAYLRGSANQVMATSARHLVEQICAVYGIAVTARSGDGLTIPQFNVVLTETAWSIIERVARYSAMLAYEGANGGLILSRAGADRMASGVREGVNLERAGAAFSADQRYSLYEVVWQSVELLGDVARAAGGEGYNQRVAVVDVTVGADRPGTERRFRPLIIVSDQVQPGQDIAERRAQWERNRRNGRARSITVTVDSWRDAAGRLWEPNCLAPVHVPSCHVVDAEWIIAEVSYLRDASGTHAELTLMPPEAFEPEPIVLQPFDRQVLEDLQRAGLPSGLPGAAP